MGYDAEHSDPLYKHCPYIIVLDEATDGDVTFYAILYDTMQRGEVNLGKEISAFRGSYRYFKASTNGGASLTYFMVLGTSFPDLINNVGKLIGRPCHPPM